MQDHGIVWLLDGNTLHPVHSLIGVAGRQGGFDTVSFSPDGDTLLAAGTYKVGAGTPRLVRRRMADIAAVSVAV